MRRLRAERRRRCLPTPRSSSLAPLLDRERHSRRLTRRPARRLRLLPGCVVPPLSYPDRAGRVFSLRHHGPRRSKQLAVRQPMHSRRVITTFESRRRLGPKAYTAVQLASAPTRLARTQEYQAARPAGCARMWDRSKPECTTLCGATTTTILTKQARTLVDRHGATHSPVRRAQWPAV